jgi:hypothetical protein
MPIGLSNSLPNTLQAQNKVKHKDDKNQRQYQQQYQQQQQQKQQQHATPPKIDLSKIKIEVKQTFNLNYLEFIGQMNKMTMIPNAKPSGSELRVPERP